MFDQSGEKPEIHGSSFLKISPQKKRVISAPGNRISCLLMGDFIEKFPEYINELKCWTQSDNHWMRRAAAVSLIVPAKHGRYLDDVLEIADLLLTDNDARVRKGYEWLLKEARRNHPEEVFHYIMRNRKLMPRTALRYAIELMPEEQKAEAIVKNW